MLHVTVDTPTGPLTLVETSDAITGLSWEDCGPRNAPTSLLEEAAKQVTAYFDGALQRFDLPLKINGSAHQIAVCNAMSQIPFGQTRTYGDIARELNRPAQAIGQACGGNPIPVIVPCHRVLGANGLGGFSGGTGIETKVWLLKHEGAGLLI